MKMLMTTLALGLSLSLSAMTYKIDSSKSQLSYVGKKVTGEHSGNLTIKSGKLEVKNGVLSNGEIIVDMNTLTSTDITDPDYNAKYVTHMKSEDFFNTSKFPESKLVIKKSEEIVDQKTSKKHLKVTGDLTMLGVSKPITFEVHDFKVTKDSVTGTTKMTLDRTLWGLKYGSSSFFKGLGDKAIENNFNVEVKISALK